MSEILKCLKTLTEAATYRLPQPARPTTAGEFNEELWRFAMLVAQEVFTFATSNSLGRALAEDTARKHFPLSPKKVLREEPDPLVSGVWWRWNGRLEMMCNEPPCHSWEPPFGGRHGWQVDPTAERIDLWASLKATPHIEVPDDGS